MSRNIRTYSDLLDEKARMKKLLAIQYQRVLGDWDDVKQEFEPLNKVFNFVGKITTPDKRNPLLNTGLKIASNVFLSSFVLAKAGWLTKLAVPFVMKNYSSHLLADKGKSFFSKIGGWLKRGKKSINAF